MSVSAISEPSPVATTSTSTAEKKEPELRSSIAKSVGGDPRGAARAESSKPHVSMDDVQALVLAGGPDEGNPLTKKETRAALRFAATYRLIDFPLANCINSKMKRIFVLTQWNSHSVNQHVNAAYPPEVFGFGNNAGWVDVLPSFQTPDEKEWSKGSADCVRRHLQAGSLKGRSADPEPEAYLILSGEALYRMDYSELLKTHNETGAEVTIATSRCRLGDVDATNLGICSVSEEDTAVYGFREKPTLDELKKMAVCGEDGMAKLEDCEVTVNMGVYIFSRRAMKELVNVIECVDEGNSVDFGNHILPMALSQGYSVHAHPHEGYWQPVRNLQEWYHANMGLCAPRTFLHGGGAGSAASLIDPASPIFTVPRCLPPAAFRGDNYTEGSIISEGVVVGEGCKIVDSIVGPCVVLGAKCDISETIFLGHPEFAYLHGDAVPDVGDGCVLKNVVVDADVLIGAGCVLTNAKGLKAKEVMDEEGHGYIIKDGIITLLQGTVLAPGTVI